MQHAGSGMELSNASKNYTDISDGGDLSHKYLSSHLTNVNKDEGNIDLGNGNKLLHLVLSNETIKIRSRFNESQPAK